MIKRRQSEIFNLNLAARHGGRDGSRNENSGLMMDPVTNMPIVILKDDSGDAVLPIWVGIYEANAIALEIEKVTTPRPMTHDLIKNVLIGLDTRCTRSWSPSCAKTRFTP